MDSLTCRSRIVLAACLSFAVGLPLEACGTGPAEVRPEADATWRYVPDLPVSPPPYTSLVANYKERLAQPYVFVELRGSYTETGRRLPELHAKLRAAGVAVA